MSANEPFSANRPIIAEPAPVDCHYYRAYGLDVRANVEIPGFPRAEPGRSDVEIRWVEGAGDFTGLDGVDAICRSHYHPAGGGARPFALFRSGGRHIVRWEGLCDFQVADDGSEIVCHPWPGVSWGEANPFIQGRVLPLALNFKRVVTLHGAAVSVTGGVAALLGMSGAGKSTLSATFHSLGHTLISDDLVAVWRKNDVPVVESGARYVRLDEKSLDFVRGRVNGSAIAEPDYDKMRLTLRSGHSDAPGAAPLRAVYLLERLPQDRLDGPEILHLSPVSALPALMQCISNRSILTKPRLAEQFKLITDILRTVPVKRLRYPSGMERLPEVCRAVESDR